MKLSIYPRKIINTVLHVHEDFNSNSNTNLKNSQKTKFNRVLSLDKNLFKMSSDKNKDKSQLNRGVIYHNRLRLSTLSPTNLKII
jgi:hypothetical protein